MYKFVYEDKEYELNEENFRYLLQDDEKEINNISLDTICNILNDSDCVKFEREFYSEKCDLCGYSDEVHKKSYPFLEYHFFLFTKNGEIVTSSISKDYEMNSYGRLEKLGKVDNSFLVSIIMCVHCCKFDIEIAQCEM